MTRRILSLFLVTVLILSLSLGGAVLTKAASAEDYPVLYSTVPADTGTLKTAGPYDVVIYRPGQTQAVQAITLLCGGDGNGPRPGAVSIWQDDEIFLGIWKAVGSADNTRWTVFPGLVLEAPHEYFIYSSAPEVWCYDAAGDTLCFEIRGSTDAGIISACRESSAHPDVEYMWEEYGSTISFDGIRSGPAVPAELSIGTQDFLLEALTTFHWNDGQGSQPGTVAIRDSCTGEAFGPWQAVGQAEGGTENAAWVVYPRVILKANHSYEITVSDSASWSYNEASRNRGMFEIVGEALATGFVPTKVCDWAAAEVYSAAEGHFLPAYLTDKDLTQPMTRAEFAAVAVSLYQRLSDVEPPVGDTPLADIDGHPLAERIRRAYHLNLAMGVSDTRFAPDELLTREQMATMLLRVVKKLADPAWTLATDASYTLDFEMPARFADDGSISDWARDSVYYMAAHGIVNGVGGSRFAPQGTATREQALAIAVRIYENLNAE